MSPRISPKLFSRPAARRLLLAEREALGKVLAGYRGERGLVISAPSAHMVPALGVRHEVRLHLDDGQLNGALRSRADESLPFRSDTFDVVVICHALEGLKHADGLLAEATRVLGGEGILVVTGFHPISLWLPWLLARRAPRPQLTAPNWLRQRLQPRGMRIAGVTRFGGAVPGVRHRDHPRAGGGFLLVAHKHNISVIPLRDSLRPAKRRPHSAWVPETHRERA